MPHGAVADAATQPKFDALRSIYGEFVCGWGSAFVNIALTFPINKVIFRQMLHGVQTQDAFFQLKHEGLRYLYRGVLPPLLQKTVSTSIMFGTYSEYCSFLQRCFPSVHAAVHLSTAAMLAGSTEAVLAPLERVQTLLQDRKYHGCFQNTFDAFVKLRKYGIKEYYRGLTPILLRNGPSNILFFGLRGEAKKLFPKCESWWTHLLEDFVSGAVIGAFISTLFYPLNVVKTKMQVCYGTEFVSITDAVRVTYEERGGSIRKIYYGVHVNYSRAFLSWGIINASYELLKRLFYEEHSNSTNGHL